MRIIVGKREHALWHGKADRANRVQFDRRWNLTHVGHRSFTAARDTVAPKLISVEVEKNQNLRVREVDILTLRFNKPMRVAKNKANPEFSRLLPFKDKKLIIVNVTSQLTGNSFEPLKDGQNTYCGADQRNCGGFWRTLLDHLWTPISFLLSLMVR